MIPFQSTEMFINMKDVPRWDPTKHYFDQKSLTLQFYEEEMRKITEGVNIGGYRMHPFMYFHLNFFQTPVPTLMPNGENKDIMGNPPLDDNLYYIIESLKEAQQLQKILFLFGCRGFAKTTFIASYTQYTILTKPDGNFSIIGGDDGDLRSITSLIDKSLNRINPAFFLPTLKKDWEDYVSFGYKDRSSAGKTYIHSEIRITNANKGSKNASEKGAGLSPIGYIMDEALHEHTAVYVPGGSRFIRDLKVGDTVYAGDGKPVKILSKINPGVQKTYEFVFENGDSIFSSANHKWPITFKRGYDLNAKKYLTSEIITMVGNDPELKIFVSTCDPDSLVTSSRAIKHIRHGDEAQVYCIGVDHPSETFIIFGDIVTGNCGKYSFKSIFESAIPSFKTQHGYKLIPILSGTSGNQELSKDAKEVLENPDVFDILPINYDRLEKITDPEYITWAADKKKKFGTFVPGPMSYRLLSPKISKPFGEFVKSSHKALQKLKINVTDWQKATEEIKKLGGSGAKEATKNRNKMYYPLSLDDCFLTTTPNPFPVAIIDRKIRELEQNAMSGRPVDIIREGSAYQTVFSTKEKAAVVHPGGNIDAPIMIYDDIPETQPEKYMNVSGLDDYKLNESDTDSLGAFYVLKRRNLELNSPCETILASYVSRPERHRDFHHRCENLIEIFAAECFMEAVDVAFEEYLDGKQKAAKWLAPAVTFAKSKDARSNARLQKKYGLFPTAGNNEYRMNVLVDWCWEQHTIGIDDAGNSIVKYGVEFIDDIELLKELRDWQKGKNSDRKEAFSHALLYAHLLDIDNVRPKSLRKSNNVLRTGSSEEYLADSQRKPAKPSSPYTMKNRSPYRTR